MLSKLKDEFQARECKLVTLCVDSKENHRKWIEEVHELQDCEVWFPVIADHNAEISRLLNLVKAKVIEIMLFPGLFPFSSSSLTFFLPFFLLQYYIFSF